MNSLSLKLQRLLIKLAIIFIVIHLTLVFYFLTFIQYFQQDEWLSFGNIISLNWDYLTLGKNYFEVLFINRTGGRLIVFTLFKLFGINPFAYGLIGFIFHAINTYLIYLITRTITKKTFVAILASLFFLMNEVGSEAYIWFAAVNSSAPALLFFLLSFYFYIKFAQQGKGIFSVISFCFLFLSLLFKETGIFAFILYPAIYLLYRIKKFSLIHFIKWNILFAIYLLFAATNYLWSVFFITGDRANYVSGGQSFLPSLLLHSIQYPIEGFIQTILPNSTVFVLSNYLTRIISPNLDPYSIEFLVETETTSAELTVILLSVITAILVFSLLKLRWSKISIDIKQAILISVLLTLLSFLPYIVLDRSFAYLDSRHYYIGTVGIAIFIATIIYYLLTSKSKFQIVLSLVLFFGYIVIHESVLYSDIKLQSDRAHERRLFLQQLQKYVPTLSNRTVIYIDGDSGGYYGLPELKVPFQSGPGYTFMIMYYLNNQLPHEMFNVRNNSQEFDMFYDILGQGYREVNNGGFGYYYDISKLRNDLKKNLFEEKDIKYLYYHQDELKLEEKDIKSL